MIHEIVFDQLRTKEQLGYSVNCSHHVRAGVCFLDFMIESPSHAPDAIQERVHNVLLRIQNYMKNLTYEEYLLHVAALGSASLDKPRRLQAQAGYLWEKIASGSRDFGSVERTLRSLCSIPLEAVQVFMRRYLFAPNLEKASPNKALPVGMGRKKRRKAKRKANKAWLESKEGSVLDAAYPLSSIALQVRSALEVPSKRRGISVQVYGASQELKMMEESLEQRLQKPAQVSGEHEVVLHTEEDMSRTARSSEFYAAEVTFQ